MREWKYPGKSDILPRHLQHLPERGRARCGGRGDLPLESVVGRRYGRPRFGRAPLPGRLGGGGRFEGVERAQARLDRVALVKVDQRGGRRRLNRALGRSVVI